MKQRIISGKAFTIIKDLALSVLAYTLPAVGLSFFIQPAMARVVSDEVYGRFLTLLGLIRLLVGIFITSLANVRQLRDKDYQEKGEQGDFNFQLIVSVALSSILLIVVLYFYQARDFWEYFLCLVTMILIMLHDYYSIYYRVVIQYKKLVIDNIIIVLGHCLGLLIYIHYPVWQIVMLSGYALGTAYVLFTSPYPKESLRLTSLGKETRKKHLQLGSSHVLKDSINYCDRLLIYPILGGDQVSVYSAAAVVGKVVQLVCGPSQRVILSYIVRQKTLHQKDVKKLLLLSIPLVAIAYGALYLVGLVLLPLMYPQYAQEAEKILWLILLSIVLNAFADILNILLLRFDRTSIQLVISSIRLTCYLSMALLLSGFFGLMGFCYGYFAAAFVFCAFTVTRLLFITGKKKQTPDTDSVPS